MAIMPDSQNECDMTDPYFGRAVPVHFYMLSLAGWGQNNPDADYWDEEAADCDLLRDDDMAAREICVGRIGLVRMTLRDFGFDVMAWRNYLLIPHDPKHPEKKYGLHGYNHPYAASAVDTVVLRGATNPDRPRQVTLAEKLIPEMLEQQLAWYQREWRDPEEPLWLAAIDGWPFDRA